MARRPSCTPWLLLLGLLATGAACSRSEQSPAPPSQGPLAPQPLAAAESPLARCEARAAAQGLEVLDVAADGRMLAGRPDEPAPRSTQKLVFSARYFAADGQERPLPWASRVQDARFAPAPSQRLAVLDAQGRLLVAEAPDAEPWTVAQDGFPGFGFSRGGRLLAFSKGQAPELAAFVLDLELGQLTPLATHGAPVWGFAFSPDGAWLAFVDSREGFPSLVTARIDGSSFSRLTNRGLSAEELRHGAELAPFPDGRRPPVWTGRALWVENADGVHALDPDGKVLLRRAGAHELRTAPDGAATFREAGQLWRAP